jgi:hypothetical protein
MTQFQSQQEQDERRPVNEAYKDLVIDTVRSCVNNDISNSRGGFMRSVNILRILLKRYFTKDMEEFEKKWNHKQKNPEDFMNMFEQLMVIFQEESEFLPTKVIEGVITDDDIQQADSVNK